MRRLELPERLACHEHATNTGDVQLYERRRRALWPFGFGSQLLISSRRKLLRSKAVVVNVAETPRGQAWPREAS
jgi:hypothetical protein